jgi:hypothetical protein
MRAGAMRPVCGVVQASVGANLSHNRGRGRYNRARPGERQFRPGQPASQPFAGGGAVCRAALKRRSRL